MRAKAPKHAIGASVYLISAALLLTMYASSSILRTESQVVSAAPAFGAQREDAEKLTVELLSKRGPQFAKSLDPNNLVFFYIVRGNGYQVFLDNGGIPVGADSEKLYLGAASKATNFIALISRNYFASGFCKKEFAHAARCRRRLIRVNVPPAPPTPNDMLWLDGPNWVREQGQSTGLTPELESALLSAIQTPASEETIADNRYGACQFLLEQLSFYDLNQLWNRLELTGKFKPKESKPEMIMQILENTPDLELLSKALAP